MSGQGVAMAPLEVEREEANKHWSVKFDMVEHNRDISGTKNFDLACFKIGLQYAENNGEEWLQ